MIRYILFSILFLSISGCATHGQSSHFETREDAVTESITRADQPGRATVYYFRERALLQGGILAPVPPLYYAVDEKILSIMPVGTYVVLSLEPGKHIFTRISLTNEPFTETAIRRLDIELNLEPNTKYYLGSVNSLFGPHFRQVDSKEGKAIVASGSLAKIIHNPASLKAFIERVTKPPTFNAIKSTQPSIAENWSETISSMLPSPAQVTSFLEIVATIAFIAIIVAGAASNEGYSAPSNPAQILPPPMVYESRQADTRFKESQSWRTSSGSTSELTQFKERATIRNASTGVIYSIDDDRIAGSDGSRYRVRGSTIYSDTGQTYRIIGNSLYSSDGRICTKSGILITCN